MTFRFRGRIFYGVLPLLIDEKIQAIGIRLAAFFVSVMDFFTQSNHDPADQPLASKGERGRCLATFS